MDDDLIARGAQAGALKAALFTRLRAREEVILRSLIQHHRDGTLTEAIMRAGIAGMAELRGLLADLDRDVRRGHDESEVQTTGGLRLPGRS